MAVSLATVKKDVVYGLGLIITIGTTIAHSTAGLLPGQDITVVNGIVTAATLVLGWLSGKTPSSGGTNV